MKTIPILVTSLFIAIWVVAIAILSVQNATPVTLKFLVFQSIQIPVGLALAFCAAAGMIGGAIAQPLLDSSERKLSNPQPDYDIGRNTPKKESDPLEDDW